VASLRDLESFWLPTRHCRAGLSHTVPAALGALSLCRPFGTRELLASSPRHCRAGLSHTARSGWANLSDCAVPAGLTVCAHILTRHCRAGLSDIVPAALGSNPCRGLGPGRLGFWRRSRSSRLRHCVSKTVVLSRSFRHWQAPSPKGAVWESPARKCRVMEKQSQRESRRDDTRSANHEHRSPSRIFQRIMSIFRGVHSSVWKIAFSSSAFLRKMLMRSQHRRRLAPDCSAFPQNASIPVTLWPMISVWMSWVPS
jgi:hypothetical protein